MCTTAVHNPTFSFSPFLITVIIAMHTLSCSLEERCREKREEVRMLNEKMEQQRRLEEEALTQFSVKMTELADNFRTARTFYVGVVMM